MLPLAQFLLCAVVLWPERGFILFNVGQSVRAYVPAKSTDEKPLPPELSDLTLKLSPEEERSADMAQKRLRLPLVLNFPVLAAQLPYLLLSPTKHEWMPRTMFPEIWRAISWPFAGLLFWWSFGRSVEALSAARASNVQPRVRIPEIVFAALLLCIGVVTAFSAVTSTPDDRRDIQFVALLAGGILWGIFAGVTILAGKLQHGILKRAGLNT